MTATRQVLEEADQWCVQRLLNLQLQSAPYVEIMALEHPEYRRLLGQHQAFMQMRSYISGSRKALRAQEAGDV